MIRITALRIIALLSTVFILVGCVSAKPIETRNAVDDRPVLFFIVEGEGSSSADLSVYVDDLYMGDAGAFSAEKKGLTVLPGTHIVEVKTGNRTLVNQKVYVGSGVSKTITVQYN